MLSLAPVLRKMSLGSDGCPSLSVMYWAMSSRITRTPELSLYEPGIETEDENIVRYF